MNDGLQDARRISGIERRENMQISWFVLRAAEDESPTQGDIKVWSGTACSVRLPRDWLALSRIEFRCRCRGRPYRPFCTPALSVRSDQRRVGGLRRCVTRGQIR
jgi:hypothetical protein